MDNSCLIPVGSQIMNSNVMMTLYGNELDNLNKKKIAENIGLEMMNNGLIKYEYENQEDYNVTKGSILVYDKNKDIQVNTHHIKKNYLDDNALDIIGTTVALLTRHSYWKDELWRKRPATKKKYSKYDSAEVHNAFLSIRLKQCGIFTTPVGSCWSHNVYGDTEEEKQIKVDSYFEEYNDLFNDYWNWQCEQR